MSVSSTQPTTGQATCPVGSLGERFEPLLGEEVPVDFYDEARANEPVCYSERLDTWFVTGTDEIRTVLRDPTRYSSLKHWMPWKLPPEVWDILDDGIRVTNTFTSDPPRHNFMRAFIGAEFTLQRIADMEPRMREIAHSVIDEFEHRDEIEFSSEFGDPFCMTVMGDLVGYPRGDQKMLKHLEAGYINVALARGTLEDRMQAARDHVAHQRYYLNLIEQRRKEPKNDFISRLLAVRTDDGQPLPETALVGECLSLQIAGHSTPVQCLGFLLQSMMKGHATLGEVDCPSEVITAGFEEIVRQTLLGFSRTTTEPVELGGQQIPAEARVYIIIAAANRDAQTMGSIEFDAHRPNAQRHLGFGWGRHFCVGAHLARMEGRVAFEVLRERLPGLHVAPGFVPEFIPNTAFRKIRELPVRLNV